MTDKMNYNNEDFEMLVARLGETQQRCTVLEDENKELRRKLNQVIDFIGKTSGFQLKQANEKPNYFDVMRPFGKEGAKKMDCCFDYGPILSQAEEDRALLLHDSRDSLDISRLPYAYVSRFITLLDSAGLRGMSYTNKYFYVECISLRGLEVQMLCMSRSDIFDRSKSLYSLPNGRLIVKLNHNMGNHHPFPKIRQFFPFFKSTALLYQGFDGDCSNIVKNYSHVFCTVGQNSELTDVLRFLHNDLESVEIKIDPPYLEGFPEYIQSFIEHLKSVKTKNLSIQLVNFFHVRETIRLKEVVVENVHPDVQNLYFCHPPHPQSVSAVFNGHSVSLYDRVTDDWVLQAYPDARAKKNYSSFYKPENEMIYANYTGNNAD